MQNPKSPKSPKKFKPKSSNLNSKIEKNKINSENKKTQLHIKNNKRKIFIENKKNWIKSVQMNFACMNSSHNIAVNLEGNISFGTMNLFANNFNITVFGTLTVDEKYTTNKIEMIIDEDNFCELLLRTRNNNWIEIKTKTEKKGYVLWKTFKMNQKFPTIFSETYVSNGDILGEEPELTALAMRCYSRGDALFFVSVISNTVDPVPITLQIDREGFKLSSKTESPVCVPLE